MKITAPISEILRRKANQVWSIAPHATVFDAIALMAEKNIGALPVVEAGRLIGILSERDYTRKVILHGKSSRETTVREIMTNSVTTVGPATSIDACMQLITQRRIRHLPVLADGRLTGMISIGDLVNWIISAQSAALEQMENYIHGGYAG
jgi:CBS domain-containing protein